MNKHEHTEWMKLDNAALIYPAAQTRRWNALFRLSAQLNENVEPNILLVALANTLRRFPNFRYRLRRGLFWYYLEEIDAPLPLEEDVANPCVRMNLQRNNGYMFRVRYHGSRIAVEIFHALTDGTGGLCFLKTLTAEYLRLRYGAIIPPGNGILDCAQDAAPDELEDSFLKYARHEVMPRREQPSYCIKGTQDKQFMHIITGLIPLDVLKNKAAEYDASVGEFITAVLVCSIADIQARDKSRRQRQLPLKICVPVNLRNYYPSNTLRNFASYVNPGIEPRYGAYSFEEVIRAVKYYMGLELNEKRMNARFSANVKSVLNPVIRITPLPIKQFVMKRAFIAKGDRYTSSIVSNLGSTNLPDVMQTYVSRLDFMLGPLYRNPVTCGCLSYNEQAVINFTRTIVETNVERDFFTRLVKLGVPVRIESNDINE